MITQDNLDDLAKEYNRTKDPELKKLWFDKVKEFANNGLNNSKRRIVSISSCHKANDGSLVFVGRSRLLQPVRHTKTKVNRVRK